MDPWWSESKGALVMAPSYSLAIKVCGECWMGVGEDARTESTGTQTTIER